MSYELPARMSLDFQRRAQMERWQSENKWLIVAHGHAMGHATSLSPTLGGQRLSCVNERQDEQIPEVREKVYATVYPRTPPLLTTHRENAACCIACHAARVAEEQPAQRGSWRRAVACGQNDLPCVSKEPTAL